MVYTTPNPDLAFDYSCPHQIFEDGFFYKVILDVRVNKPHMWKRFTKTPYNVEELFHCRDVAVAGFWICNDVSATQSDSRIYGWDWNLESIPPTVVEAWYEQGHDIETAMPYLTTNRAIKMHPIGPESRIDHRVITTSPSPDGPA